LLDEIGGNGKQDAAERQEALIAAVTPKWSGGFGTWPALSLRLSTRALTTAVLNYAQWLISAEFEAFTPRPPDRAGTGSHRVRQTRPERVRKPLRTASCTASRRHINQDVRFE